MFDIPSYPRLKLTLDGQIYDTLKQRTLKQRISDGYKVVTMSGDVQIHIKAHRLICEAYHGPAPEDKPYVNHIDGNKLNNEKENLEWVSASENAIHAFKLGLRTSTNLFVKDFITDSVEFYYSLREAAKYLNVPGSSLLRYLSSDDKYEYLYRGRYGIVTSESDFVQYQQPRLGIVKAGSYRPLYCWPMNDPTKLRKVNSLSTLAANLQISNRRLMEILNDDHGLLYAIDSHKTGESWIVFSDYGAVLNQMDVTEYTAWE